MKKGQTVVYLPPGAKINVENNPMDMPKVMYENRKRRIDIEAAKKVTGGKYGRDAQLGNS